ncbi:MAG TPA: S8 family serine peptidase, partial [Thermoanaerobaculia bacterium]|nr:S8 family serine peptidase [Thermoanaerobaculia bacterium]
MKIGLLLRVSLAALTAGVLLTGSGAHAQAEKAGQPGLEKIHSWVIENTRAGAQAEYFVVLKPQANLAGARQLKSKLGKGRFVYETLFETARETQRPILEELDALGVEYRSFYLVNAILVKGDRNLAKTLAARPDVKRIDGNPVMRQTLPRPHEPQPLEFNPEWEWEGGKAILAAEPGVSYVRAPQIWNLGYTGQGVVVGGADTGYRWTHAALKNAYRGWNGTTASHDYNWHDSVHSGGGVCGANSAAPCDDNGHGTHTMGTAVGAEGANQVGVAP